MKKKWLMMGAGFGIGAVMLLVSGFSAMANTSGYDAYKTALKNNKSATSITSAGSITVKDKGTEILRADFNAKIDHTQNEASVAVTLGNGLEKHAVNVFNQDNKFIFKDGASEVYKVKENGVSKWKHNGGNSGPPKQLEPVIDALMGNLKELATVEATSDGGKQSSLHLSGNQIPTVVQAFGSILISKVANVDQWNDAGTHSVTSFNLVSKFPKLVENIKIQQINLDASINKDQYLEHQTGEIIITGTDGSGEKHEVVIGLDFNLSNFNQTVPDQVDLTGKQVEAVQKDEKGAHWRH
jgi:hypothetical protein